jgi:hypothetical protein
VAVSFIGGGSRKTQRKPTTDLSQVFPLLMKFQGIFYVVPTLYHKGFSRISAKLS